MEEEVGEGNAPPPPPLFDEMILSKSLPHVLELIFVRHLPYSDLESCMLVSDRWRRVLSAHLLAPKENPCRLKCDSDRLAQAWKEAPIDFTDLDLEAYCAGGGNSSRMSLCFVDCGAEDTLVVLTRHGQRRCLVLRLEGAASASRRGGARVLASCELVLPGALSGVLPVGRERVVLQVASPHQAVVLRRDSLRGEEKVKIGGGGPGRGKRLTVAGCELFNLLRKSGSSPDVVVTRLLRNGTRLTPHSVVSRRPCPGLQAKAGCAEFQHCFGGKENNLLAVACPHGVVTLHDHNKDITLWSSLHLPPPYSDRLMELTVCDTHVSAAYCHHRPEVAGEEEQQEEGGNAYTVDVMAVKGGSLMHRFEFRSWSRPVTASSPSVFVLGRRSKEEGPIKFTALDPRRGKRKRKARAFLLDGVGSGFQRAEVVGEGGRLLVLQAFTGQPMQRSGEVLVVDMEEDLQDGAIVRPRVISGLHYSGPLNHRLLTRIDDTSFMTLRRLEDGRKALSVARFRQDPEIEKIFQEALETKSEECPVSLEE